MCGICGIYNFGSFNPVNQALIRVMCSTMVHRGPDEEGLWIDGNIGLGHRRLSIIDLSTGQQPMSNEDGTIWIVFNGEIYNYRDINIYLKEKGHNFRTRCDTETIIHLYEEKGEDFLKELRGMFAIALWDARNKKMILARDRLGKKPLYYFLDKDRIIFASELKAILCDQTVQKEIDPTGLSDYLSFLYVPAPKTIFKKIKKLEPASYMVISKEGIRIGRYWNLSCKSDSSKSLSAYISELKEHFIDCVESRIESDVPLGAFLSGGIDSSAVVIAMSKLLNIPVNTTSIGFRESGFNELPYAQIVAEIAKTNHHEYILKPDFIEYLPDIIWHLDEPFADSSALPTYLLCKMTKQNVTVALSGDGGDENFAGYSRYISAFLENHFRHISPWLSRVLIKPFLKILPEYLRGYNFLENLTISPEQAMANTFFYFDKDLKKRIFSEPLKRELGDYSSFSFIEQYFRDCDSDDLITRLEYVDVRTYLPEDILMKVDKMSMAHSLEVRAPFLDHKMVEFVFSIPSQYKLNSNGGKYILKKMLSEWLPSEILYRKKSGFAVPIDFWFRGKLKNLMENVLFEKRTLERGYFNPDCIKWLWERYQKHPFYQIDLSHHLWALFVFELWNRIYMDGERQLNINEYI
jgi:asparagine synthase (glutamine-hydrolysing)